MLIISPASFGLDVGQRRGYCGHPEIELALIHLWQATGDECYLRLSQFFVEERGQQPHYYDHEARARGENPADFWAKTYEYNQSHAPIREQGAAVGHAVRAMYLYSALADLAAETDDTTLLETCVRLFSSVCEEQLYRTGGIGAAGANEGFTGPYDLPNATAYAETCAAIGLVFWMQRLVPSLRLRAAMPMCWSGRCTMACWLVIVWMGLRFSYESPGR